MSDPAQRSSAVPHWAERMVRVLDDGLRIPGTSFRIGLDGVLGLLVPELGDVVMAISGLSLIWAAIRNGAPKRVIARMLANIALDALVGAVPVLGDAFDFVFKANRRNLSLLEAHRLARPVEVGVGGYLLLGLAGMLVLCALAVPIAVSVLIARWLFR